MSAKRISRIVVGRSGKPRTAPANGRGSTLKGRTDWKRLAAMKESDVVTAARLDLDAPATSRRDAKAFKRATLAPSEVKAIRRERGLSQSEFAARYGINVRTLQDWEQGRVQPDGPARAYLLVILREPRAVERALATA